ncbi:hypothetical protein LWM68_05570 [Niabella sp. W65]|nr:hypothetical protein [Niabella sp. W65]MCH7362277.1 hypothetical protein [Niabella sp. W65]ULT46015.1 hypothetical protein KRR40_24185 [Niabella sp. I65]
MDGQQQIAAMMQEYRDNPPQTINGSKVITVLDYDNGIATNVQTHDVTPIDLPRSNVLQFVTEDGSLISARPSGTEPKIKFYFSVKEDLASADQFDEVNAKLDDKIKAIIKDMKLN